MVVVHLSDNTTLDGTGDVLNVHEIALETEFKWNLRPLMWQNDHPKIRDEELKTRLQQSKQ